MRMVTVAAVQMHCSRDVTDNLERAEQLVRQAAAQGANVILLPELFERQYFCQERQYDYYQYATPLLENPAVQRFQKVAAELQVVLPISFYERAGNNTFNSVAVLDADGSVLGCYRKTHIPDDHFYQEKFYFTPGLEYTIWLHWRWNLLGSVVSGNSSLHGIAGSRIVILSNCNWFRTAVGYGQFWTLAAVYAGACSSKSDACNCSKSDWNRNRRTV